MVQFCCIIGCGNRSNRDNKLFFRLPIVPKLCDKTSYKADIICSRRKQWLLNIGREDLKDGDGAYSPGYIRVCSDHFVSGKPSVWSEVENIDWAPTLKLNCSKSRVSKRGRRKKSECNISKRRKEQSTTLMKRSLRVEEMRTKQKLLELQSAKSESSGVEENLTSNPIILKIMTDSRTKYPELTETNNNSCSVEEMVPNKCDSSSELPIQTIKDNDIPHVGDSMENSLDCTGDKLNKLDEPMKCPNSI